MRGAHRIDRGVEDMSLVKIIYGANDHKLPKDVPRSAYQWMSMWIEEQLMMIHRGKEVS